MLNTASVQEILDCNLKNNFLLFVLAIYLHLMSVDSWNLRVRFVAVVTVKIY
jgi:hypothetical protein